MITMILISSVAMLVGIVGSVLIWGFDAHRAEEIERARVPVDPSQGESPRAIGLR